ncbi:MAG: TonB-dependent receptor domain-containing protein [Bryobacteraceae bacterium]
MGLHTTLKGLMLLSVATGLGLLAPESARAQVLKGQILGVVEDQSGAVIPGAQVRLTDVRTNFQRSTETNESGNYFFVNLDPGLYRVDVTQQGFTSASRTGIDLQPNTTARANFTLSPGSLTEVIEVSALAAPLLQTDRADTGGKIEQVQLQNMPLLYNRNYQGLLLLIPGVGRPFRPHSVFYNSQDSLSVRVNGQGRQYNNFQIEGIENKIDNGNLTALVPPAEAIQNVDVSTSNFDPEFGNAGGAVTNVTLRSGSNEVHGSLFHFHRNENIQARNVFGQDKAHTVYNQFGGTLGGPIRRDKMFFFGDYQGSRDHLGQVNRAIIPGMDFRRGNLSASPTVIYDPATGTAAGRERTPFPNNQIPTSRISPIAQRIIDFVPAPNLSAPEGQVNFDKNTVLQKSIDQFDVKYDWVMSSNDRLAVRYSYQYANVFDPGLFGPEGGIYGGPRNGGFAGGGPARTQSPGLTFSKVFSPTFVWESRLGVVRNRNDAINQDSGRNTSEEIGIRGANIERWSSGLSQINIAGYSTPMVGFSPSLPWARSVTSFGIVNNFSKTFSNHIVRFGVDIRRERNDLMQTQAFNPRGRFEYAAGQAGDGGDSRRGFANAFAAFLLDVPNVSGRDFPFIFPARRELNYNLYFQDKWQVSSKLTVDLGLRYEIQRPGTPRHPGGYSNYNYFNNTLELAGLGNIPMDLGVNTNWNNFGPRAGISYRVTDTTVIRSGFGISFIPRRTAQMNFPVMQNNGWVAANAFIAAPVTMATGFPPPEVFELPADGIIRNPLLTSNFGNTPLHLPVGYVQAWNFAIQRALPGNFAAEVAYVGNHGVNNQTSYNVNASMIPGSGNAGRPLFAQFGRIGNTNTSIGTHTYYHSLQTKFDRRFQGGFMLTTAYTWSKGTNFTEDIGGIAIPLDVNLNKARMADNRTHVFVQSYIYEVPFGKGKKWIQRGPGSWIVGGWQFQGVFSAMSGSWFTPSAPASFINAPGNASRPDVFGPINYPRETGPGQKWFDISAFANPAQNSLGNAGRNILVGPGIVNLDASLFRDFPIREGMQLTLRVESFNFTNTPHFNNPNAAINSAAFGEINTALQDQRQFQIGLTLRF